MALWLNVFPQLSWADFRALPASVVQRAVTYLSIRERVRKDKEDLKHG